ncbi:MAG: diacylglycerol/lipid kinase family protein [Lachnospiraceae bacterium]
MYYFIVNQKSRGGASRSVWREIHRELVCRGVEYKAYESKYERHAWELARKISSLPEENINLIVVGGDGTLNEVLNGIVDLKKVRLGVIPTGSGNDFARGVGIIGTPTKILSDILDREENDRTIDLGQIHWEGAEKPRIFCISAGIGLDAIVCKKALHSKLKNFLNKVHLGKLTYLILTVETLFRMETGHIILEPVGGEKQRFDKTIFVAAMNLRAEGGGVPMAPKADYQDGKLSLCLAYGIPQWVTFFCLPFLVMAKHEAIKGFKVVDYEKCKVSVDRPMVLHTDGEYCADVMEVEIQCLPKALRLLNP